MKRDAVLPEEIRQPIGGVGVEVLIPQRAVPRKEGNLALRLPQGGGGLDPDVAAADDDDLTLQGKHFLQCPGVADGAQIDNVAEIRARHLRTHGAAARGEAGFLEFDGLPVAQDGEVPVEVELRDHGVEPQVDLLVGVPIDWVVKRAFHLVVLLAEELFR